MTADSHDPSHAVTPPVSHTTHTQPSPTQPQEPLNSPIHPTTRTSTREPTTVDGRCSAAANHRGEHVPCDEPVGHTSWPHSNAQHQLIWAGDEAGQRDRSVRPVTLSDAHSGSSVVELARAVQATLVDCHHGSNCRDTARDAFPWPAGQTARRVVDDVVAPLLAGLRGELADAVEMADVLRVEVRRLEGDLAVAVHEAVDARERAAFWRREAEARLDQAKMLAGQRDRAEGILRVVRQALES